MLGWHEKKKGKQMQIIKPGKEQGRSINAGMNESPISAQEHSSSIPTEFLREESTISAPRLGSFIVFVLAFIMLSLALFMGKKFLLTNTVQDAFFAILGLGVFLGSINSGLSSASQKITLSSQNIIESNAYRVKTVLSVSEIRACKAEKRMVSHAWVGIFDFSMLDRSKHEIKVAAKIFYRIKEEMKKRYEFCLWK